MENIDKTINEALNEGRQGEFGKIMEESESEEGNSSIMDEVSLSSVSDKKKNKLNYIKKKKNDFEVKKETDIEKLKKKIYKKSRNSKDDVKLISKTSLEKNKSKNKSKKITPKQSKEYINSNKYDLQPKYSSIKNKSKEIKKRRPRRKKKLKMSDSMMNMVSSFGDNKKLHNHHNIKKEKILSTIRGFNISSPKKLKPYPKSQMSLGNINLNNSINKSSKEINNYSFNAIHALFKNNTKNFRTKKKRSKISNHLTKN